MITLMKSIEVFQKYLDLISGKKGIEIRNEVVSNFNKNPDEENKLIYLMFLNSGFKNEDGEFFGFQIPQNKLLNASLINDDSLYWQVKKIANKMILKRKWKSNVSFLESAADISYRWLKRFNNN